MHRLAHRGPLACVSSPFLTRTGQGHGPGCGSVSAGMVAAQLTSLCFWLLLRQTQYSSFGDVNGEIHAALSHILKEHVRNDLKRPLS